MSGASLHTAVLIAAGMIFMLASLTGIIRLPDFFTRLHAQGVGDTLGAFLILAGMMVWTGVCLLSVKILLIFIIIDVVAAIQIDYHRIIGLLQIGKSSISKAHEKSPHQLCDCKMLRHNRIQLPGNIGEFSVQIQRLHADSVAAHLIDIVRLNGILCTGIQKHS